MKLEGIHHITAITGDAQRNLDFYARVMGLRLVKKTVNQDDPSVYHLFYADEEGSPGADLTFFEYPGAPLGRAGDGMVHRIVWRVASAEALDFWAARLADEGVDPRRDGDSLVFADPEGLEHELRVSDSADAPLIADHPEVPRERGAAGLRRRAGLRLRPRRQPRPAGERARLHRGRRPLGAARRGPDAAGWPTTPRPPSAATRPPAPCTTWPSPRPWTTTRPGARPRPSTAPGPPR